jgi:hypothetical protein
MHPIDGAPLQIGSRIALTTVLLAATLAPAIGCASGEQPNRSLRADLAVLRSAKDDPEAIGTLDATAPPPDLNEYRRPFDRTASAH